MTLVIAGGEVVGTAGRPTRLDVVCRDGVVVELRPPASAERGADIVDATGCYVAPGFIDLQINGGFGHDFTTSPDSIARVAELLPRFGVTAFAPTIVTAPPAARAAAREVMAMIVAADAEPSAVPLGLHFEGPLISAERAGAHDVGCIGDPATTPDTDTWDPADGVVLVTLAPELPGALELIRTLVGRGVAVSAGHTACTAEQMAAAREAGVTAVTHLFNAMAPFGHRSPGPAGMALADESLVAGLICDGVHVDPLAVRVAWRALGPRRTMLVSDAVAALGASEGSASLAGRPVSLGEAGVRTGDGVLAGSDLALDRAVRNLVAFTGCGPADAIATVTSTPAGLLGLTDRGRVAVGARADLVVLDPELYPVETIVGGETAWRS